MTVDKDLEYKENIEYLNSIWDSFNIKRNKNISYGPIKNLAEVMEELENKKGDE